MTSLEAPQPVTADTVFRIGSTTKTMITPDLAERGDAHFRNDF